MSPSVDRYSDAELNKMYDEYLEDFDKDNPDLAEDWRDRAYTAKEQLKEAFVEFDPVWTLVAHGKVKDDKCGVFMHRKVKKLKGCLRVHLHDQIGVGIDGVDYRNKVLLSVFFIAVVAQSVRLAGLVLGQYATLGGLNSD
jgi:hypothetical protein